MQDSDNKEKVRGRHAAPIPETPPEPETPTAEEEALQDDYDLYEDEAEIPVRRKKKSSAKAKAKKPAPRKNKKTTGDHNARRNAVPPLFSDTKFRRKHSLFEIMSATGEDSVIPPLRIFGHEIRFWPIFAGILLIMLIGVLFISNGNVQTGNQSVTIVGLPSELENCNILVISDMNGKRFGDLQSTLVRQVEAVKYNMILCVGDMVGKGGDPTPFYEFLEGISYPGRVYFVCGDSDPGPFVKTARDIQGTLSQIVLEDWILGAIERGANYVDAPINVEIGDGNVWLTPSSFLNLNASTYLTDWKAQTEQEEDGTVSGLTSDYNTLPFTSYRYQVAQRFYKAAGTITSDDMVIALSHVVPDDEFITSSGVHSNDAGRYLPAPELIVSGHNCGGVWKLPFFGAFYVQNNSLPRYGWFPAKEDVSGLSQIGVSQVYISGGLSTNSKVPLLPFRLLNNPEITLITLTATLPENMLEAAK